jgi:hypothetical protein
VNTASSATRAIDDGVLRLASNCGSGKKQFRLAALACGRW